MRIQLGIAIEVPGILMGARVQKPTGGLLSASNIIAILSVLATIVVAVTTIKATYDIYSKGQTPPKSLKTFYFPAVDPLGDIQKAKDQMTISVRSGSDELSNLKLQQTYIQNNGQAPILPVDIYEPLSISTTDPWRIVSVVDATSGAPGSLHLKWIRVSDTKFKAEPALINPGDIAVVTVYLTNKDYKASQISEVDTGNPKIAWSTRIANMRKIQEDPKRDVSKIFEDSFPVIVTVWGWGVPFLVASFSLFLVLYVVSLNVLEIIKPGNVWSLLWIVGAGALSLMAAEAGTTYVFGPWPLLYTETSHLLNAPIVVVNALLLGVLVYSSVRRLKAGRGVGEPEAAMLSHVT